jgi:hypothetical protein
MGYYTSYKLTLHEPSSFVGREEELIGAFRKICDGAEFGLTEHGNTAESIKWYDHEDDLCKFSRMYPEVVFKLSGEGEESGDQWVLYVKNGKSQRCKAKITYEDYDEQKLV